MRRLALALIGSVVLVFAFMIPANAKTFTCPSAPDQTACFWPNFDGTGTPYQAHPSGGENTWRVIPSDDRASETNNTDDTLWVYAVSGSGAGTYGCIDAGDFRVDGGVHGRFFLSTIGTCESGFKPLPPQVIKLTSEMKPSSSKRFTCPTDVVCAFQGNQWTGNVVEWDGLTVLGNVGSFIQIPVGNRGSITNKSNIQINEYSKQSGAHLNTPAGTRDQLANVYGYWCAGQWSTCANNLP